MLRTRRPTKPTAPNWRNLSIKKRSRFQENLQYLNEYTSRVKKAEDIQEMVIVETLGEAVLSRESSAVLWVPKNPESNCKEVLAFFPPTRWDTDEPRNTFRINIPEEVLCPYLFELGYDDNPHNPHTEPIEVLVLDFGTGRICKSTLTPFLGFQRGMPSIIERTFSLEGISSPKIEIYRKDESMQGYQLFLHGAVCPPYGSWMLLWTDEKQVPRAWEGFPQGKNVAPIPPLGPLAEKRFLLPDGTLCTVQEAGDGGRMSIKKVAEAASPPESYAIGEIDRTIRKSLFEENFL